MLANHLTCESFLQSAGLLQTDFNHQYRVVGQRSPRPSALPMVLILMMINGNATQINALNGITEKWKIVGSRFHTHATAVGARELQWTALTRSRR